MKILLALVAAVTLVGAFAAPESAAAYYYHGGARYNYRWHGGYYNYRWHGSYYNHRNCHMHDMRSSCRYW